MECPYCKKAMVGGTLYGDSYKMKWIPENKKLLLGIWAIGGKKIGAGGMVGRAKITAHFCDSCKKIIF